MYFSLLCDGVVIRASASQLVDLGFNSFVESYQKTLKMVSTASLLGARHLGKVVEDKPASSLVVSLVKALNGRPPPLCGRQEWFRHFENGNSQAMRTSRTKKYSDTICFFVNEG